GTLIGALLITGNAGFVGCSPQTLFGRRLELPVNCRSSPLLSESFITAASCPGRLIRLIAILPNPPLAILLPRCGVQMKTARLIRGFARTVVARTIKLSQEFWAKMFLAVAPMAFYRMAGANVTLWPRVIH